ncbi:MAG: carbonic anhydrase [Candidatus Zixiibacteriota bacterium]
MALSFCTAINCIDGRTQIPVIDYLRSRFKVEYVDIVSEPGPVDILSSHPDSDRSQSIFDRVELSMRAHNSCGFAIVAHYDCAGNPVEESEQRRQLKVCVRLLARKYPEIEPIGLWIDNTWSVCEV